MLHVKNLLTLLEFSFRKHCLQGYFCCHTLDHLNCQLIVGNATIYYCSFSTFVGIYCFSKRQWNILS